MNEEEKKVINYLYNLRKTIDESIMLFDEDINVKHGEESKRYITIILNLIEKLQREKEELKNEVMEKDLEIIGKEEYTKASMKEIIEKYYTANEECIPKQKVKDKIEEIKAMMVKDCIALHEFQREAKIDVLKELLEGDD